MSQVMATTTVGEGQGEDRKRKAAPIARSDIRRLTNHGCTQINETDNGGTTADVPFVRCHFSVPQFFCLFSFVRFRVVRVFRASDCLCGISVTANRRLECPGRKK